MALPNKSDIQTLQYAANGGPAAFIEASNLNSKTLSYSSDASPVYAIGSSSVLNLFLGSINPSSIYLGSTKISSIYMGSQLVWSN